MIDTEHGYLKSLRFPALFDGASARSIVSGPKHIKERLLMHR